MKAHMKYLFIFAAAALLACSSNREPPVSHEGTTLTDCYTPVAVGNIVGFGVDGQPRNWGSDGRAVKPALDMLVNDLGSDFFRVESGDGETDWEATNDDGDPNAFNWAAFDAYFSTPAMQHTFEYIRYLNQLGVAHVELTLDGGMPMWMGTTSSSYPQDGRAYVLPSAKEDEFVETCVALMLYARTRTLPPVHFDLFSPWNERSFATGGEGIAITDAQVASVLHKLVVRMNAIPELTGIQLVVGEDASEPWMITSRQAVQNDALVMARTAAFSYHRYSDHNAQVFGDWTNSNPPVWLTELNSTWITACYDTTWGMGLEAAGNLLLALQNGATAGLAWSDYDAPHAHQANGWQTFGLLATTMNGQSGTQLCNVSPPSDAALDALAYTPKPTYYALRHAFKWIRPNATRVTATDNSGSVDLVAYKNADNTFAVFGRNTGGTANVTVTLTGTGLPSYLTPRTTTASTTDVVGSPVPLTSGQGVFSLPGSSVFTLLSSPGDGSGGQGGMGAGGAASGAGGQSGSDGVAGDSAGMSGGSGAPSGGQSGSSAGGQSGAGGMTGGAGQGGAGTSSGGAGAGGAGAAGAAGSGGSGPPLIAGWSFDEGSGTSAADASGHGHTGTVASGVTWTSTGCKYGGCLSFPGTSGKRVTVADANDLDLTQNFTLMAWVLPSNTTAYRTIMIKEESAGLVYLMYSAPKETWLDFGGGDVNVASASGNLSTTTWSHVAFTYDGATAKYWLNGAVVASSSQTGSVKSSTGVLGIGGHSFWGGEWFAGKMDDPRIYGQALTSAQIATAMGAGL